VGIALVPDVPDDLVARAVEDVMKGDGQLDHPQRGAEMSTPAGDDVQYPLPDLPGELVERLAGEALEVLGAADTIEEATHGDAKLTGRRTPANRWMA
jgi:hypothetical protein